MNNTNVHVYFVCYRCLVSCSRDGEYSGLAAVLLAGGAAAVCCHLSTGGSTKGFITDSAAKLPLHTGHIQCLHHGELCGQDVSDIPVQDGHVYQRPHLKH